MSYRPCDICGSRRRNLLADRCTTCGAELDAGPKLFARDADAARLRAEAERQANQCATQEKEEEERMNDWVKTVPREPGYYWFAFGDEDPAEMTCDVIEVSDESKLGGEEEKFTVTQVGIAGYHAIDEWEKRQSGTWRVFRHKMPIPRILPEECE